MPGTSIIEIARAAPGEAGQLGEILGRAFHDDPVFRWVVPDPDRRRATLPRFFALFAEHYIPLGETYLADGGTGAAAWAPPGTEAVTEETAEEFGERLGEIVGDDAGRGAEIQEVLDVHHPDQPVFYLQWLGVVPDRQRQGIGGRMLATVLERCDADGTPAFLDATSEGNRRLYERHGFEVVTEMTLPDGPPVWPMWRDPVRRL